jgi:hypothetical protein
MRTFRLALLVTASIASLGALATPDNYSIDLKTEASGLDVVATATPGPLAQVDVTNRSGQRVRCFVDFEGGKLTPWRKEAWLEPGTVARVNRRVNDPDIEKMSVQVSCGTLSPDEAIPPVR